MEKINDKFNWIDYNEKLSLSNAMFSLFTLDEIKTLIAVRENRSKKILSYPKEEQDKAKELLNKIEDMFDV